MFHTPGERFRAGVRAFALVALCGAVALPLHACAQTPAASQNPSSSEPATRSATLSESRETAVVRAAEMLAPSIVTVNVLQTEQVCTEYFAFFGFCTQSSTRGVPSLGSGFVVDPSGIVLTNEHVVRGAERILVTFGDGRDAEATLIGADPDTDVAVLKIEASGLVAAPIGSSSDLRIGEWVIAFGSPFGNLLSNSEPTVTVGVTSALNRHLVDSGDGGGYYLGMIQTDAAINPGNSGGPLANADGEVVGMNSSIFSRSGGSEGMGFAIPIERALRMAEEIREHGHVRRAWLGLHVEPLEADEFGRVRGVRVVRVATGSPGDRAGIRVGDVLLEVNGKLMSTLLDYQAALIDSRAGDELALRMEGGWAPVVARAVELPSLHAPRVRLFDGLEVMTLTEPIRGEFAVTSERGALVSGISGQIQSVLRLQPGDVIVGLDNERVEGAEQLEAMVGRLQRGVYHTLTFERGNQRGQREFVLNR